MKRTVFLTAALLVALAVAAPSLALIAGARRSAAPTAATAAAAVPGLVAAYGLDEASGSTVTDASGNGNTGTLNGPTRTAAGRFGSALTFDGVNDWVTVADAASLDLSTAMTLEAWVYPTSGSGWRTAFVKETPSYFTYALYTSTDNGRPSGHVYSSSDLDTRGTAALALNTWTHLAATWDGATLRLYVNGTQASSRAVTGSMANSAGVLRMGGNAVWGEWFAGRLDEIRVYNRALSAAEVQSDQIAPVTPSDSTPPTAPANLAATGALSSVALTWTAATDNVAVTRYNVHRGTSAGFTPGAGNRVAQPTGTAFTDSALAAGTYYYKVTAEDAVGNVGAASNEAIGIVTGDTVSPSAPTNLVATGSTGSASLTWTPSTDNVSVTRYNVHRSQTAGFTPSAGNRVAQPTGTSYNDPGLAPGTFYYRVTAEDAAGNLSSPSSEAPAIVTGDTTAPTVAVTAPAAGATVSGTTTVSANASDNVGVVGVQFRLDGANLGAEDTASPYSISWNTTTASNAGHTLTAVARDAAGNATTASAVGVTVDNTAPPPSTGLVAAYAFDEASGSTVTDVSGYGNTGTLNGPTRTTSGRFGSALTFDGVNDWVTVADAASLDLSTAMTLEAWVYPTTSGGWRTAFMKETPSYFTYSLYASTDNGRPSAHVYSGSDLDTRGTSPLTVNAWSHLAATWDGTTLRLYVNGTQASSLPVSGSMANSAGVLRMGGNAVWGEWFAGRLDEIRVYNRALSAAEVLVDVNLPVGAPPPPDTTPPTVAVTAPVAGSTVSGTTSVTASASDNIGVLGVQFKLDGANIGAEDTSAPYSVSWDTTTASNASHTLTAVARDASNQTTSSGVGVTVSNTGDPAQVGSWSNPVSWPIVAVHMSLLPTGNVIAFDGFTQGLNSEHIWNPSTGTLTPIPYGRNLFCAGHVLLSDGRTLIVGGHIDAYVGLKDTTLYNASTGTWTRAPDMAEARWYPTATVLGDGRVLTLAGDRIVQNRTGQPHALTDASVNSLPEVYNPQTNAWTSLSSSTLTSPLYPFMFVLSDGRVLDAGPDTTTRILNPANWTWSTVGTSTFDGHSAVMYRPNKIMKSGTWGDPDFYGPDLYTTNGRTAVIDMSPATPAWRETAPMAFGRSYHNLTMLPDGTVFASGGGSVSDGVDITKAVYPTEIWNPDTETWRTVASLHNGRLYHSTALLLPDGRVLMAGGGQLPGSIAVNQRNAEIYSPPYLFKGARPTITDAPGTIQYGQTFAVTSPTAASIASVSLIRTPSVTHAFDQNQRFQFLNFTRSGTTLNVTAPATSNVAPPGYYMLFLVDTNGVPSVASFVRFPASWEDTVPPSAPGTLTATPSGANVSLAWGAASDNNGVTRYNVYRSTTPSFTPALGNRISQPTGTAYTDSGLANGTYYYRVRAEDAAGNLGNSSNEASATVASTDTTPPTVSITAPAGGATVSGTTTVSATASDNVGVAGVQFRVGGVNVGAEDTTSPYSVQWDTTGYANGAQNLTAVARDAAGNQTTSSAIGVNVQNGGTLRVLVGNTTVEPAVDYNPAGVAEAFQFTASSTGTLSKISIYVDATATSSTIVAGVYTNATNRPGTLLAQGTLTTAVVGGWNEISVPAASITSGTTYWIAFLGPNGGGVLRFRDRCCGGGTRAEISAQSNLATLPATWSSGTVYLDGPASLYGSGP